MYFLSDRYILNDSRGSFDVNQDEGDFIFLNLFFKNNSIIIVSLASSRIIK